MFKTNEEIQKLLYDNNVYSAWQFILYSRKNLEIVQYCYDTIIRIIDKLENKTERWEQELFANLIEEHNDGKTIMKATVTEDNSPVYELRVAGEKVNPWFLFEKMLRDFYQYSMNTFDSISQIANAGLLGEREKKVDTMDFQALKRVCEQEMYSRDIPMVSAWVIKIFNSDEYKYIEAINNRTKHTGDVSSTLALGILGSSNKTVIGSFSRKGEDHEKKELCEQLQQSLQFLLNEYDIFMDLFYQEVLLRNYVGCRIHSIGGVHQQKMGDEQNFSYAYIDGYKSLNEAPNEIELLLVANEEDTFYSQNAPFEYILIKGQGDYEILGRYISEEELHEDTLLKYRKYKKDTEHVGGVCMALVAINKEPVFYKVNPFFNVTTVSDDKKFLARTQIPI